MVYDKTKPSVNFAENEHNRARERYAAEKAAKAAREEVDTAPVDQQRQDVPRGTKSD